LSVTKFLQHDFDIAGMAPTRVSGTINQFNLPFRFLYKNLYLYMP